MKKTLLLLVATALLLASCAKKPAPYVAQVETAEQIPASKHTAQDTAPESPTAEDTTDIPVGTVIYGTLHKNDRISPTPHFDAHKEITLGEMVKIRDEVYKDEDWDSLAGKCFQSECHVQITNREDGFTVLNFFVGSDLLEGLWRGREAFPEEIPQSAVFRLFYHFDFIKTYDIVIDGWQMQIAPAKNADFAVQELDSRISGKFTSSDGAEIPIRRTPFDESDIIVRERKGEFGDLVEEAFRIPSGMAFNDGWSAYRLTGMTEEKATQGGISDYWYRIDISLMVLAGEFWVFGGYIEFDGDRPPPPAL